MREEPRGITPEEAQQIVNWAFGAGSLLRLLDMRPDDVEPEQENEVLRQTFDTMVSNMPDFFADATLDAGIALYEQYIEEERLVEEFRKQLEDL